MKNTNLPLQRGHSLSGGSDARTPELYQRKLLRCTVASLAYPIATTEDRAIS